MIVCNCFLYLCGQNLANPEGESRIVRSAVEIQYNLYCNMELFKFEENSKYGYRDENETIFIPAKYEDAKDFKDNCAIVKHNGFYGVINSSDEPIIDFLYNSIEEDNPFFECKTIQGHEPKEKTFWYNRDGILLHEGKANALSEKFLCTSNGNKYGVITQDGKRIINCIYDEILLKGDLFIVLREDKLGLYDLDGTVILDAFCNSIESVEIENNPMTLGATTFPKQWGTCYYPGYCKEYFFDPNGCCHYNNGSIHDLLFRRTISVRSVRSEWMADKMKFKPIYEIYCWRSINDITKPMIISTGAKKIIFTKSEGILPNSEFDDIQQITPICYVVKKDNLFGVYRIDTKKLVVPIDYESIRFYGGHTVLVCKDNLWGAKSLGLDTNIFNILFKVSIPNEYLDIKILDDYQHFFGCKKKSLYSSEEYYTIVQSAGKEIEDVNELKCDSQFIYIDTSHFMTSIGGKFGFINSLGQKVIPFKYDEITAREDGRYNVRIDNRWGVLAIDGHEIIPLKYASPLPQQMDKDIIVVDGESNCSGLIDSCGVELIPTIYEHLQSSKDDSIYFFGRGGYIDEEQTNFFSYDIINAIWGAVNKSGKQIIEAKYDCLKIQSNFIIAGRDGGFFPDDDDSDYSWHGSNYGGVYDLYNKEGELLIGGFREFEYDEHNGLYIFFFGGEWKEYPAFDDDWNNIHITGYRFERGIDLWLILDKDLKTILRDKDGKPKQFEKGFIGEIEIKKEENKIKHVYNMPIELMAKGFDHVAINSIIINDSNSENHKSQAIDIGTGRTTKLYSKIEQITEFLFFFADGDRVGITNIESEHIIEDCLFITKPVSGYIFVPKEKTEGIYDVFLHCIDNLKEPIATAITDIPEDDLIHLVDGHWLKMTYNENNSGLKSLLIPRSRFFKKDFMEFVSTKEGTDYKPFSHDNDKGYFFSNDYHFLPDEPDYDNGDYGDHDYARDTWDAMTDGMYGDMPDGFEGDYSFLGY